MALPRARAVEQQQQIDAMQQRDAIEQQDHEVDQQTERPKKKCRNKVDTSNMTAEQQAARQKELNNGVRNGCFPSAVRVLEKWAGITPGGLAVVYTRAGDNKTRLTCTLLQQTEWCIARRTRAGWRLSWTASFVGTLLQCGLHLSRSGHARQ